MRVNGRDSVNEEDGKEQKSTPTKRDESCFEGGGAAASRTLAPTM